MIYLHKILPVFVSPLFIVLVFLTIGLVKRRRAWLIAGVCLLFGISLPIVSEGLIWVRQHELERLSPADVSSSEAIVVLGQGMSWVNTKNGLAPDWGDPDRFFAGVELIQANKAPRLVFTGGRLPWDDSDQTEGDVLKQYAQRMQVPADKILVTQAVENTAQEAQAVRKLLGPGVKKIILVTSAFHMRRAKWLFENMGFEVLAYPVDVSGKSIDITWQSFLPNPWAMATVHSLVREGWGLLYYRLTYLIFQPVVSNE
jgi:uncharacterized SAM-binding protein YcdF (DUF218 family)